MLTITKTKIFHVPCKNKNTGKIHDFPIEALCFKEACEFLRLEFEHECVIGYCE